MKFRLFYRGSLKSNGKPEDKQALRRAFLPQLRCLWNKSPLVDCKNDYLDPCHTSTVVKTVDEWNFTSIVNSKHHLIAELDVLLLRPEEPGSVITQGGDIDNRLKTLLDALSIPQANQIPNGDKPGKDEDQFHCLFEDDNLITHVSITVDRLLENSEEGEVVMIITVDVSCTYATLDNIALSL